MLHNFLSSVAFRVARLVFKLFNKEIEDTEANRDKALIWLYLVGMISFAFIITLASA